MAVQTGSATNPEVCGVPAAIGTSIVTASRSASSAAGSMPASVATVAKASLNAAVSAVTRPFGSAELPARRNAARTTATKTSSFE